MGLTENLLHLYRVDKQTRGLRGRLDAAERFVAAQERQLDAIGQQRLELEARRRQIQARIHNIEMESAGLDERIEKLRGDLNSASTTKQYSAVLSELEVVKRSRTDLEERELKEMEQVEQLDAQLVGLAADMVERTKVRDVAVGELRQRQEDVGQRLSELEREREAAAAVIPAAERRIFNEIADANEGEAMAAVEEIDRRRREYSCGACNMELPFESIATLLGAGDVLKRCTACGRILYLEAETRGAFAKK
jgi:predicted  nucleic acid-binding Zn-ribbon protein